MKALKQKFRHDPNNGVYGDCHRTCYAMILGREPEEVPHFAENGPEDFHINEQNFLDDEWLEKVNIVFPGYSKIEPILETMNALNPDKPFILGGM